MLFMSIVFRFFAQKEAFQNEFESVNTIQTIRKSY